MIYPGINHLLEKLKALLGINIKGKKEEGKIKGDTNSGDNAITATSPQL